jgi:hypothetical protein
MRTAEVIRAELRADMGRFPDHRHVASWAAICPGNEESAGKRKTGKTRKGDSWLRTALIEAANSAAGRTRDTYLNAQYVRAVTTSYGVRTPSTWRDTWYPNSNASAARYAATNGRTGEVNAYL